MSKLYIGNLSSDVSQELLHRELNDRAIDVQNIVVNKRGFAFIDLPDQVALDKAIEKLSGLKINGKEISVEHSVPRTSRTRKIQIRNIPSTIHWEDLDSLLSKFGRVDSCEQVATESETASVNVVYHSRQEALAAVRELNGHNLKDQQLRCSFLPDNADSEKTVRTRPSPFGFGTRGSPDTPLKMLVPASVVGAIIGKGGSTVRQITQLKDSRARVDVHRREGPGSDKVATIYGAPEACGAAAIRILEIVRKEEKDNELPLKVLAHNALIGRLIGRDGRNLKHVQDKTGTRIAISSMHDLSPYNMDRTISIHGEIKGIAEAEQQITEKLRQFETDMAAMSQQSLYPGLNSQQMQMFPGLQSPTAPPAYNVSYQGNSSSNNTQETVTLLIPSGAVGAIIGSRGTHIRNISRIAGASIRIHPPDENDEKSRAQTQPEPVENADGENTDADRDAKARVTIVGVPESQWKAQFCIFDKLKQEGWFGNEEGRLTTQITIPGKLVGRIIGKGGVNVRELQRITSSEVTIPRQGELNSSDEIPVSITGTFFSNQSAQRKIRDLVGREIARMR
ncbi:Oidioi.mRNA.OKI2018_I69.chr1.g2458.t1.cds [Oikopleura dioica]|uniref:Oidioi.mRNA.OKI2018_I69.chr1.g2458.t1.cds n=1 Tax=Oikopleura dioica TaxID=34765 RepID=A0ABN7SR54_OIKDI|nr:Oidioi.mRNA.OKI2018_I69.chr1.g2458.t1.cds [Oikopleura dioica]